jgi:hypothetical protein
LKKGLERKLLNSKSENWYINLLGTYFMNDKHLKSKMADRRLKLFVNSLIVDCICCVTKRLTFTLITDN